MKILNGAVVPEYHPLTIKNARGFLERTPANGLAEARALAACADLLEAIDAGHYKVVEGDVTAAQPDPHKAHGQEI